jgi:hypothetical protein
MDARAIAQERPRKAIKRPVEALEWVREGQSSLKRSGGLESWPFPTFKGQPLDLVKYSKSVKIDPQWPEALL